MIPEKKCYLESLILRKNNTEQPNNYSLTGFILNDENIKEIYENDRLVLENNNITYKQIANILSYYAKKWLFITKDIYTHLPVVINNYSVNGKGYLGSQECPSQNSNDKNYYGYKYGVTYITVTNTRTEETLTYNTLLPHMIKTPSFFRIAKCETSCRSSKCCNFF